MNVDVTIKMISPKDRHLAIASGDVQCAVHSGAPRRVVAPRQVFDAPQ